MPRVQYGDQTSLKLLILLSASKIQELQLCAPESRSHCAILKTTCLSPHPVLGTAVHNSVACRWVRGRERLDRRTAVCKCSGEHGQRDGSERVETNSLDLPEVTGDLLRDALTRRQCLEMTRTGSKSLDVTACVCSITTRCGRNPTVIKRPRSDLTSLYT